MSHARCLHMLLARSVTTHIPLLLAPVVPLLGAILLSISSVGAADAREAAQLFFFCSILRRSSSGILRVPAGHFLFSSSSSFCFAYSSLAWLNFCRYFGTLP